MLTIAPAVLAVSYDALYSSFGKFGAMNDRGVNSAGQILLSNAIITASIYAALKAVEIGLNGASNDKLSKLDIISNVKKAVSKLDTNLQQSYGDDYLEELVMTAVMTLIGSFEPED